MSDTKVNRLGVGDPPNALKTYSDYLAVWEYSSMVQSYCGNPTMCMGSTPVIPIRRMVARCLTNVIIRFPTKNKEMN
jgi:hypothetical protein